MADEHEKDIRNRLCRLLYAGQAGRSLLRGIPLDNASSHARTLYDLVGEVKYEVIQDNTRWNPRPEMLRDLIGGMIPAIVLRSDAHEASGENRILVEVKKDLPLGHGVADSQAVRYFLYLLAMTHQQPERQDMTRALLLAAPSDWFHEGRTAEAWREFRERFAPLANAFEITLGEIHTERLPADPWQ
jgi:hypothetical protein